MKACFFPKTQPEKLKTNGACTESTGVTFQTFKENIHLMTLFIFNGSAFKISGIASSLHSARNGKTDRVCVMPTEPI